jgi:hypothetical protein
MRSETKNHADRDLPRKRETSQTLSLIQDLRHTIPAPMQDTDHDVLGTMVPMVRTMGVEAAKSSIKSRRQNYLTN